MSQCPHVNSIQSTDTSQFDLKFTKGNSVVLPEKLVFFQKKYAEKYISEDGVMFNSMIQKVLVVAEQYLAEHPQ